MTNHCSDSQSKWTADVMMLGPSISPIILLLFLISLNTFYHSIQFFFIVLHHFLLYARLWLRQIFISRLVLSKMTTAVHSNDHQLEHEISVRFSANFLRCSPICFLAHHSQPQVTPIEWDNSFFVTSFINAASHLFILIPPHFDIGLIPPTRPLLPRGSPTFPPASRTLILQPPRQSIRISTRWSLSVLYLEAIVLQPLNPAGSPVPPDLWNAFNMSVQFVDKVLIEASDALDDSRIRPWWHNINFPF